MPMIVVDFPLLTFILLLPLAGALLLPFARTEAQAKWLALSFSSLDLLLVIWLVLLFEPSTHHMQFQEQIPWIPALNIHYQLGVDGLSILFVFLTALMCWICLLASWQAIQVRIKQFLACILVMQSLMLGVFCALDLFLFYIFWEAMLIPMYLLIGVWGGSNRHYATLKFFLYTLLGSLVFLLGILAVYFSAGNTFNWLTLSRLQLPFEVQFWVFLAFFIGFAIKVPMFPFHTWLPDAHVQAPTAGSIILAGVLLKMGGYGFLRFSLALLPEASQYFSSMIGLLSVVAILYGGLLALAQTDLKKLVAYSSISHMGFVTLGLFTFNKQGVEGAILQMFNHGIVTGALFLFVGFLYERAHCRDIANFGGLMKLIPLYSLFFALFTLASMALPGTGSFVGELYVLSGTFAVNKLFATLAIGGTALSAIYLLGMYRQVALGPITNPQLSGLKDLDFREIIAALILLIFVVWLGFYPLPFIHLLDTSVEHLLSRLSYEL